MHNGVKLLTGLAMTILLVRGAAIHRGQAMHGALAQAAADAMQAEGVPDGSVAFRNDLGLISRVVHISGTADAAARARVIAALRRHPGVADARWVAR
jgi:hypothetical protein